MNAAAPTSVLRIDLKAYADNLRALRERLPEDCGIFAVVKANAYGLGAVPVAKRAVAEGARMLGVATVAEGVELRAAGIDAPVLVLVQAQKSEFETALRHKLTLSISDFSSAEFLGDQARKAKLVATVHCEVDTGMNRQGFASADAAAQLRSLTRISHVDIEGVYTHFASAERPEDGFADQQLRVFQQLLRELESAGVPFEMAHAANSAAALFVPSSTFDLVRAGLVTYGVWPGVERPSNCGFRPVASWTTRVGLVRDVPGGASVSYGRSYFTESPSKIASIPVGYADGYPFSLSNKADVLVRGRRCRVRGRVTMNETLVEVTDIPGVAAGDVATLLGRDGNETVTVEELAARAELPPHAVLTSVGASVGREYSG